MSDQEPSNVDVFLRDRSKDLRRIASRTKGEYTFEDLAGEAWMLAVKLTERRGHAVDFADLDDQEQVLAWLYKQVVDFADKSLRNAERLDKPSIDDDGKTVENALQRLLVAPEASDPLVLLQSTEEQKGYLALVRLSYSQATAYVLLLVRFGREDLATYLRIAQATLASRVLRAADWLKFQPSMFDGKEYIDEEFLPAPGRDFKPKTKTPYVGRTWDLWPSHAWTRGI